MNEGVQKIKEFHEQRIKELHNEISQYKDWIKQKEEDIKYSEEVVKELNRLR